MKKEGRHGSARVRALPGSFVQAVLLGSNHFGTSDKLTVRERIVFYRLLPIMPCEKYGMPFVRCLKPKVILML